MYQFFSYGKVNEFVCWIVVLIDFECVVEDCVVFYEVWLSFDVIWKCVCDGDQLVVDFGVYQEFDKFLGFFFVFVVFVDVDILGGIRYVMFVGVVVFCREC